MSRAFATETEPKGWLIPQAVQMIPAALVLILIWFTPESPRWYGGSILWSKMTCVDIG